MFCFIRIESFTSYLEIVLPSCYVGNREGDRKAGRKELFSRNGASHKWISLIQVRDEADPGSLRVVLIPGREEKEEEVKTVNGVC